MLLKIIALAALVWAGAATSAAQTPAEQFRNALSRQAAFTADEFGALERGEMVVKLLPSADKREVAFCGVMRLQGMPATVLAAFKESLTQDNRALLGGGRIGTPPTLADLLPLTLENSDLENIGQCSVGNCKLKMSAAMIGRLQREVNWDAPDHALQANRLFQSMLFDYVRDYLARGDAALIEYDDREHTVHLAQEQSSLLTSLPFINDSAPEFAAYLRGFPRRELPGVENTLRWSRIRFGLKPVIVVTHTATYARQQDNSRQIFAATKHLYANHYIDASFSLTFLMNVPADGVASDTTYLAYFNRSRADAFGGLFGSLKRRVVESGVLDGLHDVLQQTERNVQIHLRDQQGPTPQAVDETAGVRVWAQRLLTDVRLFVPALLIVAGVLAMWLGMSYRKRAMH
ncbi:MAG: hypothetical protein ACJ741_18025 [Pyrinomonadaceae bacterium]